jgi:hypothetical protein
MADLLIAHLREKGAGHSATKALINQWGFDEQLIPKALSAVGNMFPHYSRHDESHSKQILTNIERILGENIVLLSATDTWLLLEAAYWHDIGMVVQKSEVATALRDASFLNFLDELRRSPSNDLHKFAKTFDATNPIAGFPGEDSPLEAVEQFRLLMAEWFRRQHPARAETIVRSPLEALGLTSPRTELIPRRLFRLLGKICYMHGVSFDHLMSDTAMPFREAGMAGEDCHPRYIACLLRLGDLLDLDDNRFCPVMQRIAGENRPRLTKAHENKHAGLRHLRLDPTRIELAAECDEIDGYVETFRWFEWIRKELENQGTRWADIAPSRNLGLLPTLGRISVKLAGKFQLPAEGKRPQFSLDSEQATRLLQGSQIYGSKFACIRELLQNSADATLLRLWLTKRGTPPDSAWGSPITKETKAALSSWPIMINLEFVAELSTEEATRWKVKIVDQGIGISRDDLVYMLRIGGSRSNQQRRTIIREMPEWMKPSGTFGIGFQSIYMLTDKVIVESKSIFTNEIIRAEFFDPRGDRDGLALVETLPQDLSRDYGTSIEFIISADREGKWSLNFSRQQSISSQIFYSMDPILDPYIYMEIGGLADEIETFSRNSLIRVSGKMDYADRSFEIGIGADDIGRIASTNEPDWEFIKIGDQEVRIRFTPHHHGLQVQSLSGFYRGQPFETNYMIPFGRTEVDLMSGNAGDWLGISRDKLAPESGERFYDLVIEAVAVFIKRQLEKGSESIYGHDSNAKSAFSAFMQCFGSKQSPLWTGVRNSLGPAWQDILSKNDVFPLRHILEGGGGYVAAFDQSISAEQAQTNIDGQKVVLIAQELLPMLIQSWIEKGGFVQAVLTHLPSKTNSDAGSDSVAARFGQVFRFAREKRVVYRLCREEVAPYTTEALAAALIQKAHSGFRNSRVLIPNDGRWTKLSLKTDTKLFAETLFVTAGAPMDLVLIPYLFKKHPVFLEATREQLDALAVWLQSRLKEPQTLGQIRDECEKLVRYIADEVLEAQETNGWIKLPRVPF